MTTDEFTNTIRLKMEKDMIFKCDLGIKDKDCFIDELHDEVDDMIGPNPTMLLGSAVLGCLSSSLIFCIGKKKMSLDDLEAQAEIKGKRNEKGYLRVTEINVKLIPKTNDKDVQRRLQSCLKIFENFCTVTQSVRKGIPVNVDVQI